MKSVGVIGLAGGFAYGVRRGGGDLLEVHEPGFGRELFKLNMPGVDYIESNTAVPLNHGWDFLFGCPPCAGWSTASAGLDRKDAPEHAVNDGIRRWFIAVSSARPAIACFESVVGCLRRGQGLWGPLARRLEEEGYRWSFVVYDNQDIGVPQKRERMLFWCWRTGDAFVPEVPPHAGVRWTAGEALSRVGGVALPDDPPDWAWQPPDPTIPAHRLLPYVLPGSNARRVPTEVWLEHYWEAGVREGWPSFTFRRLHPDRPAPVMMANALAAIVHHQYPLYPCDDNGRLHPNHNWRLINGRELAILMGYPPEFQLRFRESERANRRERDQLSAWLTQAVSPKVGSWAATCASVHLENRMPTPRGWQPVVWDLRRGKFSPETLDSWAATW